MVLRRLLCGILAALVCAPPALAQIQVQGGSPEQMLASATQLAIRETSGSLFENVVTVLQSRYVDQEFRTKQLPALVAKYREQAAAATTLKAQRQVVHQLLSHIPASHLGLLSAHSHRLIFADLLRVAYPNFGFQLIGSGEHFYAGMILQGGPAARGGLLTGDRIVTIDGVAVIDSPRLDWRTDDAYIGDERDPSVQHVIARANERAELRVERKPGEFVNLSIAAEEYSAFDAAEASVRVFRSGGKSIGYLHFWYVHIGGVPALIQSALAGRLKDVDALVIDLRGRGGSAGEVPRIVSVIREYRERTGRPVVALSDRQSRSGKDILVYEFKTMGVRIVGEASAGAVIPASFADVGHDSVLMFPTMRLPKYTDLLELKPVEPDVHAARPGLYAAGRDGIIEAGIKEALRLIAA